MSSAPAPAPPPPPPPSSVPKSVIPSSNKALLASIQKGTSLKKVPDTVKNDRSAALVSNKTTSSNSTPLVPSNTSNNERRRSAAPVSMGGMDLQSQLQQKLRGLANNNNINVKPVNAVPVSNNKPMNNINSITTRPISTHNNMNMNKPTNPRPMMGPGPVTNNNNNNSQPTVGQFLNNRYKSPPNPPPSYQPQIATVIDQNNNTNKAINNWKSNINRAPPANQYTASQTNTNKAPPPPPANKKPAHAFGSSAVPSVPKQKVPAPPPPYAKRPVREPQQCKSAPAPPAPNQRPISAQCNSYSSSVNRVTPNPPPPVSSTISSSSTSSGHINNQRHARPQSNVVPATPYNNSRHSITSIQNKPAPPPPPAQRYPSISNTMHQRPAPAAPISPARSASITSIKQSPPPPPPNMLYTNQIHHPPPPPVPMRVTPGIPITNGNYSYNRVMDRAPPPPPPFMSLNQPKFDSKFRFPLESQFPTVARIDQSLCSNLNSTMNRNYY